MKSIMEEASSISKAIETAWNRAGQPTEFSVKVLELPQTSFFGLKTSKSAKVAFFFNEATVTVRPKEAGSRSETDRRPQQRPVTLRQPGNRSENDQQRRPYAGQRTDRDNERAPRTESDNRQPRETREPRDNRGFEQKQDQRNRPQNPRYAKPSSHPATETSSEGWKDQRSDTPRRASDRTDYTKPHDSRSNINASSTHSAMPAETSAEGRREHHSDGSRRTSDRPAERNRWNNEERRPRHSERSEERSEHSSYNQEPRENWTPEMAQIAQEWIKETLVLMGKPDITVNIQVSHNYLKVNLSAPVLDDARQEETQLKSWGMLAMEAVREKMGKPLRSLRIVLESPR